VREHDRIADAIGLFLVLVVAAFMLAVTGKATLVTAVRSAAPTEIKLADPWGGVGLETSLRAVEVGGMECAILISGQERSAQLWCHAR